MHRMPELCQGRRVCGRRRAGVGRCIFTRAHVFGDEKEEEDTQQPGRPRAGRGPAERRDRRPHALGRLSGTRMTKTAALK